MSNERVPDSILRGSGLLIAGLGVIAVANQGIFLSASSNYSPESTRGKQFLVIIHS